MRFNKKYTAKEATQELLAILRQHPEGVRTSDLQGTPRFHGERTLRNPQIIRLLRASGRAEFSQEGTGKRTYYAWRLKEGT